MKQVYWKILVVIFLLLSTLIQAQGDDIHRDLEELRAALKKTATLIQLLPLPPNSDLRNMLEMKFQEAEMKFQEVRELVQQGRYRKARVLARQVYSILKQIEGMLHSHPVLKIKFREELDRLILEAEEAVEGNDSPEALYLLNQAKFYRIRANQLFSQGRTFQSLEFYRLSMNFARQAIKIAGGRSDRHRDVDWRKLVMDTQSLLEEANRLVETTDNRRQVKNLLNKIERELRDIQHLYEQNRYEAARQKLITVNRALYRLIDLLSSSNKTDLELLQTEYSNLQQGITTLEQELTDKNLPAAKRMLSRTKELMRQIERHLHNGQPELARRKLRLANQMLVNLYRIVERRQKDNPDELQRLLQVTRENLQELKQQEKPWKNADQFLKLIEENLKRAETAFQNKNYLQSSQLLRLTNQLILKYHRIVLHRSQKEITIEALQTDLQRLKSLLDSVEQTQDHSLRIRFENARRLSQLAERAMEQKQYEIAQEYIQMAFNLITK